MNRDNQSPAAFPDGPPPWPLNDADVEQVLKQCYESGQWGRYHGQYVDSLADRLSAMHSVDYALPCASGTVAVELALRGLNVNAGDEVILAGYDFPGNFRCIESVGATPVLADVDQETWSLDVDRVADALGPRTRAIITSHLHGGHVRMRQLMQLAADHNVQVVEDACQSPGAVVDGQLAGTWGDVSALSFGGSKLLTAGRGGAVLTRHAEIAQRIRVYCERGNHAFPLSELQAAVLLPQLEKLEAHNQRRAENAKRFILGVEPAACLVPVPVTQPPDRASYYKLAIRYAPPNCDSAPQLDDLIAAFRSEGIAMDRGFRGFVKRTSRRCRKVGSLENSHTAAERTILLHHPILLESPETIDHLVSAVRQVVDRSGFDR